MNWGTPEIAEEAQKIILGEDHVYPMIAFGTAKKKSAFKMYAKSQDLDFNLANEISRQIEKYDEALKHAEDGDDINIYDYVDEKYHSYIDESQKYWGIITDKKKHSCGYLLYNGDIREEIGLIKCKSESTKKEYITTVVDGAVAEKYKFLKNDDLKVDTVLLTDLVYKRIGIKPHTVSELTKLVENDKKVWDLYASGLTIGVNQCEREQTMKKLKRYKPKNISELTAFIAAIRPGFKSMYSKFESKENFSYGIPAFDKLIQTEQFPYSFIMYQEQTMNTLNYAGFPIDQCYSIIKDIAKKHPEKVKPLRQQFIDGFTNQIMKDDNVAESEAKETSEKVWQIINDSSSYSFNCVTGDTRLDRVGRNNGRFQPTIEQMYLIKNNRQYAVATGHRSLHDKYKKIGYGNALSMFDDGMVRKNNIVNIYPSGVRTVYELRTEAGGIIKCTANHKFPTPSGKKRLDELKLGDCIYHKGEYEHKYFDSSFTDGNFELNHPKKGECGFQKNPHGATVVYHNEINRHRKCKTNCMNCGVPYSEERSFELHHKDFDRHNNSVDNFMWVCNSCHKKLHYANGRTKAYENGLPTFLTKIVSITKLGKEQVYDVEMESPAHNFVVDNGLITSNSSHAYCMALDSLYNAWQKAHYPYEFYEVLLQTFSEKGKKDKVAELKKEMLNFGIEEGRYAYGLDNRKFKADPDNHVIYPALTSIKGLSQACANDLYSIFQNNSSSNFVFLYNTLKSKRSLDSKKINILIEVGYFDDFGSIAKIKKFVNGYDILHGKSQFHKNNLPVEYEKIIKKYSAKETKKLYKEFDFDSALTELWESLEDEKTPLRQKLAWELEHFGYIKTLVPKLDLSCYYVTDYECKYKNPVLSMYRLADGKTETVKVRKSRYDNAPIHIGDIIRVVQTSKEGKWSKDENGEWVQDKTNKDIFLKHWNFVK